MTKSYQTTAGARKRTTGGATRVKIVGPVTPERLAEALEQAALKFIEAAGEQFGGFFGANLYLQAYSSEGQQLALLDGDEPLMITLQLPDGASLRPTASPRVVEVREWRAQEQAQAKATEQAQAQERERMWEARTQQIRQERLASEARRRALEAEQDRHARQFARIREVFGDAAIEQCNAAIAEVWARLKPLEPSGPHKGQPRDVPSMLVRNDVVWLQVGAGRSLRRIQTPISHLHPYRESLEPHWKHEAWVAGAVPALQAVIADLVRQLPDAADLMAEPDPTPARV